MTSQPPQDEVEEVARAMGAVLIPGSVTIPASMVMSKELMAKMAGAAIATIDRLRRAAPAAARIGTAADIGCSEPYSCQRGRGDPPMDCIWPECPCGTLVIKPEYRSTTPAEEGIPRFSEVSCSQCGETFGPGDSGFSHCDQHENPHGLPWRVAPWGDGSSPTGHANIFSDAWRVTIASELLVETAEFIVQAANAAPSERDILARLKWRIDYQLNDYLCGMKEGYDDSITGFNEAWDIVRQLLAEPLRSEPKASEPVPSLPSPPLPRMKPMADDVVERLTKEAAYQRANGHAGRAMLLEAALAEIKRLRRGECICIKCGQRQEGEKIDVQF